MNIKYKQKKEPSRNKTLKEHIVASSYYLLLQLVSYTVIASQLYKLQLRLKYNKSNKKSNTEPEPPAGSRASKNTDAVPVIFSL